MMMTGAMGWDGMMRMVERRTIDYRIPNGRTKDDNDDDDDDRHEQSPRFVAGMMICWAGTGWGWVCAICLMVASLSLNMDE